MQCGLSRGGLCWTSTRCSGTSITRAGSCVTLDDPPCDESNWKSLAEAAACFMGFGVVFADMSVISNTKFFGKGGAPNPEAYAAELSTWLPESDIVFDLAIFLAFKELPADAALNFLKPFVADKLKTAMADVEPYRKVLLDARDGFWRPIA